MAADQMQRCRYEMKYIINEKRAQQARQFAKCYMEKDPFMKDDNCGYDIHNIYVDSNYFDILRSSVEGHKNRFKLRIRYYDYHPKHPIFFEIKSKASSVTYKQRVPVSRSSLMPLIIGASPTSADLYKKSDANSLGTLNRFQYLQKIIGGCNKVNISYSREAYVAPASNNARISFDRNVSVYDLNKIKDFKSIKEREGSGIELPILKGLVILELKFTNQFPKWMLALVRELNLERSCSSKYAMSLMTLTEQQRHEKPQCAKSTDFSMLLEIIKQQYIKNIA